MPCLLHGKYFYLDEQNGLKTAQSAHPFSHGHKHMDEQDKQQHGHHMT